MVIYPLTTPIASAKRPWSGMFVSMFLASQSSRWQSRFSTFSMKHQPQKWAQDQVSIERFLSAAVYELQDRFFAQMAPNKISEVCDLKSTIEKRVFGRFWCLLSHRIIAARSQVLQLGWCGGSQDFWMPPGGCSPRRTTVDYQGYFQISVSVLPSKSRSDHREWPSTCTVSWMVPRLKTAVVVKCWWDQSDLLACTRFAPVELEQSISPRCHSQVAACSPGLHSRLNLSQVRSGELAVKSFEDLWVTRAQSLLIAELQQIGFEAPRYGIRVVDRKGQFGTGCTTMAALAGDHL